MKKSTIALAALLLAVLLAAGLVWASHPAQSQKSEVAKPTSCTKQCQVTSCPKTEAAKTGAALGCAQAKSGSKSEAAKSTMGAEGVEQSHGRRHAEGFQSMMPATPMHQMMRRPMMMHRPGMMMRQKGHGDRMLRRLGDASYLVGKAKKLGLSDEQVENLRSIKLAHQKSAIEKRAQIQIAHLELQELLGQDAVNFTKIKDKVSQISEMENELHLALLASIQKSHKILTPEQMEKAKALKKHRGHQMKKAPKKMTKEVIIEEAIE